MRFTLTKVGDNFFTPNSHRAKEGCFFILEYVVHMVSFFHVESTAMIYRFAPAQNQKRYFVAQKKGGLARTKIEPYGENFSF